MSDAKDWNDRLRDGTMPGDPEDECEIVNAPPPKLRRMSDAFGAGVQMLMKGKPVNPLRSGFVDLDEGLRQFGPGQVSMLAADSGVGKSTLATQFALHAAATGHGAVYFNLEMSEEMYGIRTGANYSKLPMRTVIGNDLSNSQFSTLLGGMSHLAKAAQGCVIGNPSDHRTIPSIKKLCAEAEAELRDEGKPLALIVIDHILQVLVNVKNDKDGEGKARADLTKELAEKHKCHVLALVHVTRDAAKGGKMPTKDEMASSQWFSRHADNIMVFHQKRTPEGTFDKDAKAKLACQKSRWGEPFAIDLEYQQGFFYPWNLGGAE